MTIVKYKDLPKEIQELVLTRFEQYNIKIASKRNLDINNSIAQMFNFNDTVEGNEFWHLINVGKFEKFYELYAKNIDKIELISKEPIIYKGIVNNRKVKITIEYDDTTK